jgi:hypothetical protein
MTTRKDKGRNSGKSATLKTTAVNHKDMSAAAQRQRVLTYLRAAPQTTYSLRARGISHPAQRVRELILLGHQITSHPVTAVDSDGFSHRNVARYILDGELELVDAKEAEHV